MPRDTKDSAASSRDKNEKDGARPAAEDPRQARLALALRDNLKKRKAQQRQRRDGGPAEP